MKIFVTCWILPRDISSSEMSLEAEIFRSELLTLFREIDCLLKVAGLSEVATKSAEEVMRMLQRGNKERTQEPTAANKTSSRSHALLMVNVTETSRSKQNLRNGRLYMIDLAGSERASNTKVSGLVRSV